MSNQARSWGSLGTLRDKVALVRCEHWVLGFEARYVRQVGFGDLVTDLEASSGRHRGHVGRGMLGEEPCSVWDLGLHLGVAGQDRAIIVLERPGGLVAFRCGEIVAVETVSSAARHELPAGVTPARRGVFKNALRLQQDERVTVAYLLRASSLFAREEIARVQRDWQQLAGQA